MWVIWTVYASKIHETLQKVQLQKSLNHWHIEMAYIKQTLPKVNSSTQNEN